MSRPTGTRSIAAAAVICFLAGCGSSAPPATSIDAAAQTQLRQDLHAVAKAIAGHHRARARAALAKLNADTAAAHAAGRVSDTRFADIQAAATSLATDLERHAHTPAPTVTVTTSAPVPPPGGHPKPPHKPKPPKPKPKPPKHGHGPGPKDERD